MVEEADPMEHDDSDDSSEDTDDDVEASPEDMEAIMSLESSLQASPQSYELHAQVIASGRPPRPPNSPDPRVGSNWSAWPTMCCAEPVHDAEASDVSFCRSMWRC